MVRARICLWLAAGALVFAGAVVAQEAQSPDSKKPATTESKKKPALTDAVRVSTDAAVSSAAKQEAQKPAPDAARKDSSEGDVTEFHPAASESSASDSTVVVPKDSKKAKNVHGKVYGSGGSKNTGTPGAGGAVGASSKSGKTSVYVETESSRTPTPH